MLYVPRESKACAGMPRSKAPTSVHSKLDTTVLTAVRSEAQAAAPLRAPPCWDASLQALRMEAWSTTGRSIASPHGHWVDTVMVIVNCHGGYSTVALTSPCCRARGESVHGGASALLHDQRGGSMHGGRTYWRILRAAATAAKWHSSECHTRKTSHLRHASAPANTQLEWEVLEIDTVGQPDQQRGPCP